MLKPPVFAKLRRGPFLTLQLITCMPFKQECQQSLSRHMAGKPVLAHASYTRLLRNPGMYLNDLLGSKAREVPSYHLSSDINSRI